MTSTRSTSPPVPSAESVIADPDDLDPLAWVSQILWPDGLARFVVDPPTGVRRPGRRRSGRPVDGEPPRWWASPSPQEPRVLIPADSPGASKQAVRRYHDGFDLRRWARSAAAEVSMVSPRVTDRLLDPKTVVLDGPPDCGERGVLGGLRELLNRDDLRFAISLAAPKTNRKPVIQILDDRGLIKGWAKVGWNPWTDRLLANEADWLAQPTNPPIATPIVLHQTVLAGRQVVVLSGVAPGRLPRLRRPAHPDPAVLLAIAARGSSNRRPIAESGWWASVEAVLEHANAEERQAIERAVAVAGDREFSLGAWHGDFTPWNVMTVRGLAEVIDWEFAADGVPLGFDLCHYHTQVAVEMRHLPPSEALDHSARLSPHGLATLGVDPSARLATWHLYLAELIRRTLALRAAGIATDDVHQGRAAVQRLNRTTTKDQCQPA